VSLSPVIRTADVLRVLGSVRDPELDRSLVELDFVAAVQVDQGRVRVELRLPTYWCAANFAYLMASDARRALLELPGVEDVEVELVEHFAADQVNAGVAAGWGFRQAFPEEAEEDLEEIREHFARKGLAARLNRLCRSLLDAGLSLEQLAELRLEDLPPTPEVASYLERRQELGLPSGPEAPLLVDEQGRQIGAQRAATYLAWIRAVAASLDGNTAYCQGLLATRYGPPEPQAQPVALASPRTRTKRGAP